MKYKIISFFIVLLVIFGYIKTQGATYKCDTPAEKQVCSDMLNQTQQEIDGLNSQLGDLRQEGASIARDKAILDIKIKQAQLQIKAHELSIANIGKDIAVKNKNIQTLEQRINTGRVSLSQILRKTNQIDDISLPELFLGNESLSESFADLDSFDSIKTSLAETFGELRDAKSANEKAKDDLSKARNKELDVKAGIETEKAKVQVAEAEKNKLLTINQSKQSDYQKVIAEKNTKIAQIKAALFKLRDSAAIPFEDAYNYAKNAYAKTGTRPAFILAILTQESNLGSNVGSCYVTDLSTGNGKGKNSGTAFEKVMASPRDTVPFESITSALGRDWSTTPVSCPIGSTKYYKGRGFGGAMGPAQFIPSTWMLIKSRVEKALGIAASDPWNPPDAIMASGFYLADRGASAGSYSAEITAACKYYGTGGSSCSYGKQVMARVAAIQANIDLIEGN